ncbi:MAG: family 20 glycosylhydrolase [Clostridia bacterium]|nr:family 20 glycosylhydrolase [Clostridia bacterium]
MKTVLVPKPLKIESNLEKQFVLDRNGYISVCDKNFFDAVVTAKKYFLGEAQVIIGEYAHKKAQIVVEKNEDKDEAYKLIINENGIKISAGSKSGAFYGFMTLKQLIRQYGNTLPFVEIEDEPYFKIRGYMLDISRNKIPTIAHLKEKVDMLCELKINHLELYVEGAPFAFKNHKIAYDGVSVLTGEEIAEFDKYCLERFIELVPTQNTFGHMGRWLFDTPGYKHLAECPEGFNRRDNGEFVPWPLCLDPTSEEAFDFVKDISDDLLSYFSSDKYNVCCDETLEVGLGKSKPLADEIGIGRVYLNYLLKLHNYCRQKGKQMMFWADIINEYPELVPEIPKDIIALNWGYYNDLPKEDSCIAFEKSGVPYCVCPGSAVWNTMIGNTTQMLENVHDTVMKGYRHSAIGVVTTDWGDSGHIQGIAPAYPSIVYGAALSWQPQVNEDIDLPSILNLHIFEDKAKVMGDFSLNIGRYVDYEKRKIENTADTFRLLRGSLENEKLVEDLDVSDIEKVENYLKSFLPILLKADMKNSDSALIIREYKLGIDMLLYALLKARYIIKTKREKQEDLAMLTKIHFKAKELIKELSETWLIKNKLSLLLNSVDFLQNDIKFSKEKLGL